MTKLEKKVAKLPLLPGVYLFKNKNGKIIYVGKSARLRARVKSYFRGGIQSYHAARMQMLNEIADLESIETGSEIEALVEEARLIKKLKPRFNVFMRDSKNYAYVAITKETFPRIYVTHQPHAAEAEYLGPFTESQALKKTLRLLRRIFPYYTHRTTLRMYREIGLAPKDDISPREYRKNIRAIRRILTGESKDVRKELEREVRQAVKKEDYEEAKEKRDQLQHLASVIEHASVLDREKIATPSLFPDITPNFQLLGLEKDPERLEAYDISNIHGKEAVGSMVVFTRNERGNYAPDKNEYRKFRVKTVKGISDTAMMREVLERRLSHLPGRQADKVWKRPGLIIIDGGRTQLSAALRALRGENIPVIALAKRKEEIYFPRKNMPIPASRYGEEMLRLLQAIRNETHRFAITYHRKLHRKTFI